MDKKIDAIRQWKAFVWGSAQLLHKETYECRDSQSLLQKVLHRRELISKFPGAEVSIEPATKVLYRLRTAGRV